MQGLFRALESTGKDPVWDQSPDAILMSAPWRDDIRTVIENRAKFIFVISPDSVASEPCALELAQATGMAKQVITILWRDPRPLPPETDQKTAKAVRDIKWIPFADDADYGTALAQVIEAIDTDLDYARMHSRLLILSREWIEAGRDRARLPRGSALRAFEASDPSLAVQLDLVANQISSSPSSEARLVSTTIAPLYGKLTGPAGAVNSVAFSRNGKVLAAGDQNGKVWLWIITRTGSPARLGGPLSGPTRDIDSVAISPSGQILAASSGNRIWLWSLARLDHPVLLGSPLSGSARPYGTVVFSPDGNTLASADTIGTVWRWNLADPAHPARLSSLTGPVGVIFSVAFSPDGKILAAAGEDRTVWLWHVAGSARPVRLSRLTGPSASIYTVAFSRTGILAAGSGDDKVWLWNLADPRTRPGSMGPIPSISPSWRRDARHGGSRRLAAIPARLTNGSGPT